MKKYLGVLLAVVLAFGTLAGCGPQEQPPVDPASYTVAFNVTDAAAAAGVKTPANQTVKREAVAVEPEVGWKGHELTGWYDGGTKWNFAADTVTKDVTLTAHWVEKVDEDVAAQYEEALTWGEAGHLYVHYLRVDHDSKEVGTSTTGAPEYETPIASEIYKDWGLWVWEYKPVSSEGRTFNGMKVDESGVVFDIKLDETYYDGGWDSENRVEKGLEISYNGATTVGIQIFSQDSRMNGAGFWANDGGNIYIDLAEAERDKGDYHWFVRQGHGQEGQPTFTEAVVTDPYEGIEPGSAVSTYDVISHKGPSTLYEQMPRATGWDNAGVGYQVFVASFADSDGDGTGDLKGITQNLEYFQELNVDVLWLTPIQQSNSYHGYDIKDYFTIDPRFGTIADYRELLVKAHEKGIKVLMDFVINHTSDSNPWFVKSQNLAVETVTLPDGSTKQVDYRNFYNWRNENTVPQEGDAASQWFKDAHGYYYYSSFNSGMPELNFDNQATRDAILDVALYWMSFGLDGFRLDAAKHIYMENENDVHSNQIVQDGAYSYDAKKNNHFFIEFNNKLKATYPNALLVAENLSGDPAKLGALYPGLDSQFNFNTYYDFTGSIGELAINGPGNRTDGRNYYTSLKQKYEAAQLNFGMNRADYIDSMFTSNHDVQRARERLLSTFDSKTNDWTGTGIRTDTPEHTAADIELSGKLAKSYAAILMTLPGITWIYNGDEIGMFGTKRANEDGSIGHEDRWYRQPMKWTTARADSKYNTYYAIGFNNYYMQWDALNEALPGVAEQRADEDSILNVYKALTQLRKDNPSFVNGKAVMQSLGDNVFAYDVTGSGGTYRVIHNLTTSAQSATGTGNGAVLYAPEGWSAGANIPAFGSVVIRLEG